MSKKQFNHFHNYDEDKDYYDEDEPYDDADFYGDHIKHTNNSTYSGQMFCPECGTLMKLYGENYGLGYSSDHVYDMRYECPHCGYCIDAN